MSCKVVQGDLPYYFIDLALAISATENGMKKRSLSLFLNLQSSRLMLSCHVAGTEEVRLTDINLV